MMIQLRVFSPLLTRLFALILSFVVITQCFPETKYRYKHDAATNNDNQRYMSEVHLLNSKSRIRRDTNSKKDESPTEILKSSFEVAKSSDNSGAITPMPTTKTPALTTGSPRGQKVQAVESVTFKGDIVDMVDQLDTVINQTLNKKSKEKFEENWKIEEDKQFEEPTEVSNKEDHKYYIAEVITTPMQPYIDLDILNKTVPGIVREHPMLSKSYRRAATIPLSFGFTFYGHEVKNITIATGGFLYTGDYVHSWLAATQYIAPLMANFDTSSSDNSKIRYADNGTALIVEWLNVTIQSRESGRTSSEGLETTDTTRIDEKFRFQVILHEKGDIVFAYKNIPTSIVKLNDNDHPVKVGLSDAYIIDRTIFFVRRKTIYEYHRIDKMEQNITSDTSIWFRAQPTCNMQKMCRDCIEKQCNWCPNANGNEGRCSDGMDRQRQDWLSSNCDSYSGKTMAVCNKEAENKGNYRNSKNVGNRHPNLANNGYPGSLGDGIWDTQSTNEVGKEKLSSKGNYHHATITTISIVALIGISIMVWFVYAYFFPHSWSGQLLIKYRPSRWQWRRGEPRYTAASIHM